MGDRPTLAEKESDIFAPCLDDKAIGSYKRVPLGCYFLSVIDAGKTEKSTPRRCGLSDSPRQSLFFSTWPTAEIVVTSASLSLVLATRSQMGILFGDISELFWQIWCGSSTVVWLWVIEVVGDRYFQLQKFQMSYRYPVEPSLCNQHLWLAHLGRSCLRQRGLANF